MKTKIWIVVDLDGTVADCSHRLKYIINQETGEKLRGKLRNYKRFYDEIPNDSPMPMNIDLVKRFAELNGASIVFVTGRPENTRIDSLNWIAKHFGLPIGEIEIIMRREDDYRPDFEAKPELLREAIDMYGSTPLAAFEDRPKVVEAWRTILGTSKVYRVVQDGELTLL